MIAVEPRKTADRPVICPVNVVPTPQEVHKSRCVGKHAGELFPEEPEVVPAEMAKEASTEGPTDKEDFPERPELQAVALYDGDHGLCGKTETEDPATTGYDGRGGQYGGYFR